MNDSSLTFYTNTMQHFEHWRSQLTAAEQLLRQQLASHVRRGGTIQAYILRRGILCQPMVLPAGVKRGRKQQCFKNAAELAQDNPDVYVYVEGFAHSVRAVQHGWCVTRHGAVVDPTWDNPERSAYCGIPVAEDFLQLTLLKQRTWSLFGDIPRLELLKSPIEDMVHPWWREEIVARSKGAEMVFKSHRQVSEQ